MRPSGYLVVISVLTLVTSALAQDKPLPDSVQRLKQAYQDAAARNAATLRAQYDVQMKTLLQKYTQAGKLDEALALKAELAHDPKAPPDQTKLPPEAIQLDARLQKSIEAAIEPVRQNYLAELNKLMAEMTRANRLDDALAIRNEIKNAPDASSIPAPAPEPGSSFGAGSGFGAAKTSRFVVNNLTKAKEAEAVLAEAETFNPDPYRSVKELDVVGFHDFAEAPMKHRNANPEHAPGEHAKMDLVSSAKGIVVSGPYDKLEPGDYLIVYRLRFFDKSTENEVAFLDVAQDGVTRSGLRPKGVDTPPNAWLHFTLPLKVPEAKTYEFRLWGSGRKMAMDRVYVFKVKGS